MKQYLNVGCGSRYHKGWTNIDMHSKDPNVISADLTKGFPFPDNSFDVVYHSHVLEHIPKSHVGFFIKECYRVLNKDGILRIVIPDLEALTKDYLSSLNQIAETPNKQLEFNYDVTVINILDQMVREKTGGEMLDFYEKNQSYYKNIRTESTSGLAQRENNKRMSLFEKIKRFLSKSKHNQKTLIVGKLIELCLPSKYKRYYQVGFFRGQGEVHQWMYDRYSLSRLLQQQHFTDIQTFTADKSSIANWSDYELDTTASSEVYKKGSLFIEGKK